MPNEFGKKLQQSLENEFAKTPLDTFHTRENLDIGSENVFQPEILKKIREWARNKKIVIFDCHGVLVVNGRPHPNAKEILKAARNKGYTTVLWTYEFASTTLGQLEPTRLQKLLDLMIFHENYYDTGKNDLEYFLNSTADLPTPLIDHPELLIKKKNPDIFGVPTVVLDDNIQAHYPSEIVTAGKHKFISVTPERKFTLFRKPKLNDPVYLITGKVLKIIDAAFPQ